MKEFLQYFGIVLLFSVIVFIIYQLLKKFVFDKIKINKWIVLAIGIVLFMIPLIFFPAMPKIVANLILPGGFVICFLWFLDLTGFMNKIEKKAETTTYNTMNKRKNKKDDIQIRPKAKPNRVKNNKK